MTSPINSINTTGATTSTTSTASTTGDNSQLSSQAFLQLLVAQLKYQDPTNPTDTATLMNQTATLNQIQTMAQLSAASTAQSAALQQQTATNIVGHTVTYTDNSGATATGYVSAATLAGSAPTLQVGNATVALANIQQVLASSASPTA